MSCPPARISLTLSVATFPYRSSPPAGLLDYTPYLHIAAVCMFELVVLLFLGHKWGSIGVHHLWARLCSSSSVLACLVGYDTKPSYGEAPVLELKGMGSSIPLPLLTGPLWSAVVEPVSVLSMGQVELFNNLNVWKSMNDIRLNC